MAPAAAGEAAPAEEQDGQQGRGVDWHESWWQPRRGTQQQQNCAFMHVFHRRGSTHRHTHPPPHTPHSLTRSLTHSHTPPPAPPHLVVLAQSAQGGAVAGHTRGARLAVPDGKVDDEHVLRPAKALLQVGQHTARGELQEQICGRGRRRPRAGDGHTVPVPCCCRLAACGA